MSRAALAVKVGAVVVALVAGSAWFFITRQVTVRVDGLTQTVHTRARTVSGLLETLGYPVRRHDKLKPASNNVVSDGMTIRLDRARQVTYTVNGKTTKRWAHSRKLSDLLTELKAPGGELRLSANRYDSVPLTGMRLTVSTQKTITLVVAKQPTSVTTFAGTVAELVAEREIELAKDDRTTPVRAASLTDGATVTVQRIVKRRAVEQVSVAPTEQRQEDPEKFKDQVVVKSPGAAGQVEETVDYIEADGEMVERKVVKTKTITEAQPKIVAVGTKSFPTNHAELNWAALAQCESGGRPNAVSSNGMYHGLYQFDAGTWRGVGGEGVASGATPEEQTYRAGLLYDRSGIRPWPHCGPRLLS